MNDFDDIQALWKQQPATPPEVDMNELKNKANRFAKLVTLRNVSEWAACAFVIVIFVGMAVGTAYPLVTRVGSAMIALGAALIAHRLVLDGRLRELPDPAADTGGYIDAYRSNLEEQAGLLHDVWRWYLGPLVPGMVVFLVGFVVADPSSWPRIAVVALICAVVFLAIGWINRLAATKLRAQASRLTHDA
jgi:hypothetical protein